MGSESNLGFEGIFCAFLLFLPLTTMTMKRSFFNSLIQHELFSSCPIFEERKKNPILSFSLKLRYSEASLS